ncbi:MAG: RNA-guided endonuclease InsQ/TnpB family protein [Candidatus Micrarchaeia archaeon]
MRSYKFKLYPDAERKEKIDKKLDLLCSLYNAILEKLYFDYKKDKNLKIDIQSLNEYNNIVMQENQEFSSLNSRETWDVFLKVLRAYNDFLKKKTKKKTNRKIIVKFPRIKAHYKYKSLIFYKTGNNFYIKNYGKVAMLFIPGIGRIRIKLHQEIDGVVKLLTIKRYAGKYYAIFNVIKEFNIPKVIEDANPVGIDVGLRTFITLSDGKMVKKPKFVKERARRVIKLRHKINRKMKNSKRWEKAIIRLQRELSYTANQSDNFAHKLSYKLVNHGYTIFFLESLNIEGMARNHSLAAAIYNASWGKFARILIYKAESKGIRVMRVSSKNTTKKCSGCGHIKEVRLGDRIYKCGVCGLEIDRDLNAAINILKLGLEKLRNSQLNKIETTAGSVGRYAQ